MTPEQFLTFSDPLPEPMLLVSANGVILGSNQALAAQLGIPPAELGGRHLGKIVEAPSDELAHYLRLCSRSRQLVLGALVLRHGEKRIACRTEGTLLVPASPQQAARLLLRFKPKASASSQFAALNLRIEELGREIQRRKLAEAAAQEQKERLQVTLHSIGDGVIVTDLEGRVAAMNPVAESLTGWSHQEAQGRPLEEVFRIINEQSGKPGVNPALRALEAGVIVGLANHTNLIARDGTQRAIDDSAAPIRDAEGKILGAVLIFRDITDRRQSEAKLRYQSQLTHTITDNATTAIFMVDHKGRCTFMNPAAEAMTGFSFAEVQEKALHDLIHHHHPDGTPYPLSECPIDQALPERQQVRAHEDVFIRKTGEFFPVMCHASPIYRDGVPVETVIEVRDITQERQAQADLLLRSEQLRRLAQIATRINIAQDIDSVVNLVAEEARLLIGSQESTARVVTDQNGRHSVSATSVSEEQGAGPPQKGSPDRSELETRVCRNNRPLRLSAESSPPQGWLAAPLIGRDGKNIGLIQLSNKCTGEFSEDDESILVQLANIAAVAIESAGLYEALREADRRKDEFLATLAHELRNPLAPIRTGLEIMKLAQNDAKTLGEIRSTMERQTQLLIRLVDDLLDVSRITRGKLELKKCRVHLSEIVQSAIEASKPAIDESGHQLIVGLSSRPVPLDADPNRLAQVFSNLLHNAAKYTPEGGRIELVAQARHGEVIVSVRDNGIGIPSELQSRIFDMFAQIDRPMEKGYTGLGIGLTLVKSLVEMHKGRIEVHSEGPHKGSEFRVYLPILREADRSASPAQTQMLSTVNSKLRVLVADDNKAAVKMLSMVIKILGCEVRTAHDGREGVEVAGEFLPDVVLMDIGMPRMNGYEAVRHIRQQPWGRKMMVVALTGWGQEEDKRRTREAGFDHHLIKPVEPAELQRLFEEVERRLTGH